MTNIIIQIDENATLNEIQSLINHIEQSIKIHNNNWMILDITIEAKP